MAGRGDEQGLRSDEVNTILATQGFGVDREEAGAALIALDDPLRVVWANRATTRLLGSDEPAALTGTLFGGRARESLADAAGALAPGTGFRAGRLRLVQGFRTRTLTVLLGRQDRTTGGSVIVIAIPTAQPEHGPDPAFRFDALRPGPAGDETAEATGMAPAVATETGRHRFLWRTDAAHHLVGLSQAPAGLRNLQAAMRRGTTLPDLLAGLGIEHAAVAAALGAARSWSGIRVDWPSAGPRSAVPVLLGGVPLHDAAGGFAGFRGFGTAEFGEEAEAAPEALPEAPAAGPAVVTDEEPVRLDAPFEGPARADASSPAPSAADQLESGARTAEDPVPADPDRSDADPSAPDPFGPEAAPEAEAATGAEAPPLSADDPTPVLLTGMPTGVRASFSSAKIVALRPSRPSAEAGAAADRRDPAGADSPDRGGLGLSNLSVVEQLNFGEIARALRDGRPGAAATAEPGAAEDAEAILSVLPDAVMVDRGDRTVYVNPAFLALTGYVSLTAFLADGGRTRLLGGLDAAEVAEAAHDRIFPVIDAASRVLSVQGRLTAFARRGTTVEVMTFRPVPDGATEMQNLRFELARREAEASDGRTLLDRVTDPALVVDGQGRILALNRPAERVFGRDQAGVIGESLGALLTPDSQSAVLGAVFRAAAAGPDAAEARLAVTARRREGPGLPLVATCGALSGGTVGLVFRDDGELRTCRETIAVLQAERDRSGTARSEFLAKVSHEIRTPLNAILGFAEVMLDERFGPLGNPRYKDYLGDIRAAGQHVIDFVTDLTDLSAVETGQHPLTVSATDVNAIIRESVADMQGQAHRDRVIVRLSLTAGLAHALVDAKAMRQVIDNILSNAIRFNEPGGQVIVSTAASGEEALTVRIRDTGIGMSDGELAIAMEPFRDISTGKAGGGSGLGLPLTRALVEANQATLSIKSRKNEGTLVEVVLRAAPAEEPASAPVA